MGKLTADNTVTQQHVRHFIQWGGGVPGNAVSYAGKAAQYLRVEGLSLPELGSIDAIWRPHPTRRKQYVLEGRTVSPPDLITATIVMAEKHGYIPRQLQKMGCFNLYDLVGVCEDPSSFIAGWNDYVMVYGDGLVTSKDAGDRSAWDSDDSLEDSLDVTFDRAYPVGAISLGDSAQNLITLEVIDAVYGPGNTCEDCDPEEQATKWIFAVTESSGSTPGTAPRLIYSTDGGTAWVQASIDGLGDTEDPVAIRVVGPYLLVATRVAGGPTLSGYYYSTFNPETGVPGTWTKVTSGFIASALINDVYVLSPQEVFFSCDGGAIFKATDITVGVTNVLAQGVVTGVKLQRIKGDGSIMVAVGASGGMIVSRNRGTTWYTPTSTPSGDQFLAVEVITEDIWWVGSDVGRLYHTINGGESWTQLTFSGAGAGAVRDIVFPTPDVGYFSHNTADPTGRLFCTWNGGNDWTRSAPRLLNLPVVDRFNRIAVPNAHASIAANNVVLAGLGGNGTDGVLAVGIAPRL
jgi:photosystem II stability/assembly factor-like uncharacterized protein